MGAVGVKVFAADGGLEAGGHEKIRGGEVPALGEERARGQAVRGAVADAEEFAREVERAVVPGGVEAPAVARAGEEVVERAAGHGVEGGAGFAERVVGGVERGGTEQEATGGGRIMHEGVEVGGLEKLVVVVGGGVGAVAVAGLDEVTEAVIEEFAGDLDGELAAIAEALGTEAAFDDGAPGFGGEEFGAEGGLELAEAEVGGGVAAPAEINFVGPRAEVGGGGAGAGAELALDFELELFVEPASEGEARAAGVDAVGDPDETRVAGVAKLGLHLGEAADGEACLVAGGQGKHGRGDGGRGDARSGGVGRRGELTAEIGVFFLEELDLELEGAEAIFESGRVGGGGESEGQEEGGEGEAAGHGNGRRWRGGGAVTSRERARAAAKSALDGAGGGADAARVLILNTLAPVFLLVALGALMQRTKFVSPNFLKEANRVTYWLGLPALLFSQLAGSFHEGAGAKVMLGAMLGATVISILAGYLVAWAMRVPEVAAGTFVQGAFRGNLAFVGLPIIFALPDAPLAGGLTARSAAVITVAPMMVFYNVAGVVVLLLSQHPISWKMVRPFLKQLATTPPLLATIAGVTFALMGWKLPASVDKTLASLGEMALPLGLLGVGGSIVTSKLSGAWQRPLGSALVKTVVSPALGWGVGRWLGLGAVELKMVMILMACPAAIVSYTMALEMKGDEAIASGAIVLSVFTSIVTLAMIVGMF